MAQVRMTVPEVDLEDDDRLYTEQGAAQFLRVTTRSLQNWRTRPDGPMGPPYVRISSRCIRYRRRDLIAWAEGRLRHSPQEEYGRALTPQSSGAGEGDRLSSTTTPDDLGPDVARGESSVAPQLENAPAQEDAAAPPAKSTDAHHSSAQTSDARTRNGRHERLSKFDHRRLILGRGE